MAVRNIKLTVTYDGGDYHGWQIQPGHKTVQGTLTDAIQDLIGSEVMKIPLPRELGDGPKWNTEPEKKSRPKFSHKKKRNFKKRR